MFQAKCQGKEHMIESEIAILSSVSHPHIIQLEEVFDFQAEKYLIMEYVPVGLVHHGVPTRTRGWLTDLLHVHVGG